MTEEQKRVFQVQRIYVKDISFEVPGAPEVFLEQGQPKVNVQLANQARRVGEGDEYEVEVTVTVTSEVNEKSVYIAEVKQAGMFTISGASDQEKEQLLGAYCPNLLFPYIREAIASLVGKGSFTPFHLQPINFDALFQQAQAKRAEEQAKEQTAH
ncbi:MAG: protein-export chaperone SecB [Alcanivoracaceae bacterium]|nr:protein-export chaperone SecB [Alcanivoracaceae bacterium]